MRSGAWHGRARATVLAAALLAGSLPAQAHDTWFSMAGGATTREVALALSTGNRYPLQEFNPQAASLVETGCRSESGKDFVLRPAREAAKHLELRATRPAGPATPATCWAVLKPYTVELPPDKIALYFREIRPSAAVQAAWAGMEARGVVWNERYTKHARIEVPAGAGEGSMPAAGSTGMALDLVLEGATPLKARDTVVFRVLRDGQPLPDFPVELVSDRQRFGLWTRTDADGRARVVVPFAGGWLLRGTDLRLSETTPDTWESRFITLTFEAAR